jgi:triosephosphate isomerase
MRKKFVAGNWKMNTTPATARELAKAVADGVASLTGVDVAVCPPFPFLPLVAEVIKGSPVALGAQNCYEKDEGAFTGEVSPAMLAAVGCKYVILGHSERRHVLGETDSFINHKIKAALAAGLYVILCMGETLAERQATEYEDVFTRQVTFGLVGVTPEQLPRLILAYEPVWAIGTGHTATTEQAQNAHYFIRSHFAVLFGTEAAEALPILYGGSVKPDNAAALMSQPDVDGGLIGGASLKSDQFLAIVRAAAPGNG